MSSKGRPNRPSPSSNRTTEEVVEVVVEEEEVAHARRVNLRAEVVGAAAVLLVVRTTYGAVGGRNDTNKRMGTMRGRKRAIARRWCGDVVMACAPLNTTSHGNFPWLPAP